MALKRGNEIPTIDVELITIVTKDEFGESVEEIALNTASKVGVNPQIETQDAVKLIIKGQLKAQKPQVNTLTGNTIVLTDNVFNPQVVKILQGGTITMGEGEDAGKVVRYAPPVAGSTEKGEVFELCAYAAQYNAAGLIERYEKITYPNCQGTPISMSTEDNVFRAPEYTINSAPDIGQEPYIIDYVKSLPAIGETTPEED